MPEMTCNKEWRKKYGYVDLIPNEEGRKLPSGNWHFEHSSVLDQFKHFLIKLTYEIYLASHFCIPCDVYDTNTRPVIVRR